MHLRLPFWTFILLSLGVLVSARSRTASASCTLARNVHGATSDDTSRFMAAVRQCPTTLIPKGVVLNIGKKMNMTGLVNRQIKLEGTLKFSNNITYWVENAFPFQFQTQITFWLLGGKNIVLDGGGSGVIDGNGQVWYDAFASNSSLLRPITMTIFQAENVQVKNIKMINSPEWFNLVNEGKNVVFQNVNLTAVSNSSHRAANTDGWDIYRSDRVELKDSIINNGDDCVSFKPNATNIIVSNLNCNGSHGISVGSLGQFPGMFDIVENVTSTNIVMSNAENGARIKAWAGPNVGSGIVKNITFDGFNVINVDNPVIIDQCYMTNATACSQFPSNVVIEDIWFNNIHGTSSGSTVASLKCSPDGRCSDINVNDLELKAGTGNATYTCQNIQLKGDSASLFPVCSTT